MNMKVKDLVSNGQWKWPDNWLIEFPILSSIPAPNLCNNTIDKYMWKTSNGQCEKFSTKTAWNDMRQNGNKVEWCDMVWFSNCTPKHSFIMWLAVQGRLSTQERLQKWLKLSSLIVRKSEQTTEVSKEWEVIMKIKETSQMAFNTHRIIFPLIFLSHKQISQTKTKPNFDLISSSMLQWLEQKCGVYDNQKMILMFKNYMQMNLICFPSRFIMVGSSLIDQIESSQTQISVVDNQLPSQIGDTSQVRIQEHGKGSGSGVAIDIPSEIGDSSQVRIPKQSQGSGVANELPSQTTDGPSQFVNEFYSSYDPYLGDDEFNPFDGLDEILPPSTNVQNDRVEVESHVETEVRVETENDVRVETENEVRVESDTEVDDEENDVEEVAVDMENFRLNVDLEAEFHGCDSDNGVQDLDVDIDDVFDNDEFISGSEDEDEFDKAMKIRLKRLRKQAQSNTEGRVYKTYFYVGQDFGSAAEVKSLIKRHSIETRREIKIVKNDKERVRAQCFGQLPSLETSGFSAGQKEQVGPSVGPRAGPSQPSGSNNKANIDKIKVIKGGKPNCRKVDGNKCPWVLHVSKVKGTETWRTKTYDAEHKCLQSRDILYATSRSCTGPRVEKTKKKRSNVAAGASGSNAAGVAAGASQRSEPSVPAGASVGASASKLNKGKGIAVDVPGSKKKQPRKKVINIG
ncbi:reverse transcriptase domain, Reverse transcriptase zinc-binding domain protein [Artemisia annua]|uniref:Reverse transcriptase domain, Reverse transcriptase zinc-binding domain protein n=1 Tax=Artemisia annua TaxID=35608 RepID=A0A2U1MM15_ARTAN|nr:reverse transcriptase domain, Reverse transcriptase zinc-binding domain protein [Artemisia annua]